ncbi:MAG: STAS domain-containing protein [Rhodococcus sp. (in: high G+C Gram-positive bacteria)]
MTIDDVARMSLDIVEQRVGDTTVLSVYGEVDLTTSQYLTDAIDAVVTDSGLSAVVVDLTGVPFFASVGMSILVDANRRLSANARFVVVADGPATARPLMLVGLDQAFPIYSDLDAALSALAADSVGS